MVISFEAFLLAQFHSCHCGQFLHKLICLTQGPGCLWAGGSGIQFWSWGNPFPNLLKNSYKGMLVWQACWSKSLGHWRNPVLQSTFWSSGPFSWSYNTGNPDWRVIWSGSSWPTLQQCHTSTISEKLEVLAQQERYQWFCLGQNLTLHSCLPFMIPGLSNWQV